MNRLGEVVFPVSRVVGEDDDSDDGETKCRARAPVFRWIEKLLNGARKLECECLLIAIGPVASGFIDSLFGSEERETLCSISCEIDDKQTRKHASESIVWRRKGRNLLALCQCRDTVSTQQTYSWVHQLFSTAKPSTVMILSSHRVGELKTDLDLLSRGDSYPLFSLRSSSLTTRPCCPYLEPPNTVGGLGAEVLTYCEVKRLPGVLYVTFISDREPLALLIASFMPLLSCSILQPYIKDVSQQLEAEQKQLTSFMKDTVHFTHDDWCCTLHHCYTTCTCM
ncbi:proteasome assembly chaperone 1-like isoform X2 [Lytechinus variegatus]|uniref:proteasome assembly chaperone 1-like isoform X2 n=1 Tax=Lytechinus variegatus TaxID=7654 RepID=UPI001BB2C1BA|nr:proteasome assembly chaperone 1-like isoform X2 [Lytechinus variegatus]